MGSKLLSILGALLVSAEGTIPIFIHNAQSQTIEGVVVTEANQLFVTLATILENANAPKPAA